MNWNELIEEAREFCSTYPTFGVPLPEILVAWHLSLETKDEWWKKGYWTPFENNSTDRLWYDSELDRTSLENGLIFRTEEESERYRRQRIARTAIHRWIAEKAEKVDWTDLHQKLFPVWDGAGWAEYCWTQIYIPGWFYVYQKDYDRMMSENAAHFEVLKEGM